MVRQRILQTLPRFQQAYAKLPELESREQWDRTQIESHQLNQLNQLWRSSIENVPYYRELFEFVNLPSGFDSLEHFSRTVPILEKSTVRNSPKKLISDQPEPGKWHHTSGSTGAPTAVYRAHQSHRELLQARYRFNQQANVDFLDRWVYIWGNSGSLGHGLHGLKYRLKTPVEDWVRNRKRVSPYDLRPETLRQQLKQIARFRPVALYSHSMAAHLLAEEALKTGFHCPSLKVAVLTAEPVRASTMKTVAQGLGVDVRGEYGCVECGFIGGTDITGKLRVREDFVYVETLPRNDGHYDIVVTVLNNPSFPLLRYAIGDVTRSPLMNEDHGFSWLGEIEGRNFDFVVTANGGILHGQIFEDTLDRYSGIRRWQIRQSLEGELNVRLELLLEPKPTMLSEITRRFESLLEGFQVNVEKGEIKAGASGKHRAIVSELGQSRGRSQRESS